MKGPARKTSVALYASSLSAADEAHMRELWLQVAVGRASLSRAELLRVV